MLFSLFQFPSSEAAVTVQLPAEPWLCDPVSSCTPNGGIILTGDVFSGTEWIYPSRLDDLDDNTPVVFRLLTIVQLRKPSFGTDCWSGIEVNLGTLGDLKKLTQSFEAMSPDDVLRHKLGASILTLPAAGCTTAMIKDGWYFVNENKFFFHITVKGREIARYVLDYDLSPLNMPAAFETCHAITATNMLITGVANRESEGVAYIKPFCPGTMAPLKITVGNRDYSDNKIDIKFDDGRSESLTLTIDDKPANMPVQISSPFSPVEVRGKLPSTAAGKGAGVAWVKVEFW